MNRMKGFTLAELMVVVAIIGVLAAISLSNYRIYIIRAKLTDALYNIRPVKLKLIEYVAVNGSTSGLQGKSWSEVLKELGVKTNFFGNNSKYVKNAWWNDSKQEIRVSFADSFSEVSGRYFVLRADMNRNFINWTCISSETYALALPAEYLPTGCR